MIQSGIRRTVAALVLVAAGADAAGAHIEDGGSGAPAAEGARGAVLERIVELSTAQGAPVVEIPVDRRVRLVVIGAGPGTLHLHGYDVEIEAEAGAPAVLVFDAAHTGRFPLTAHGADDLLGSVEQALLYVEVRDR